MTPQETAAYQAYTAKAGASPMSITDFLKSAHSLYTNNYIPYVTKNGTPATPFEQWIGIAVTTNVISANGKRFSADSTTPVAPASTTTVVPNTVSISDTPTADKKKSSSLMDTLKAHKTAIIVTVLIAGAAFGAYKLYKHKHKK